MQHLDFNNIGTNGISNQIEEMVRRELLTQEQAQSVNVEKYSFFSSDLGQRMINADNVYREIPFCIEVNCNEIYPSLCMETETEDTVLLQGAVDCCFEEKDKIILIDFKTDYVPKGNEDKIKQMYEVQIMYYAKAISQIFCKPVDEKYIYLFWNNKSIAY